MNARAFASSPHRRPLLAKVHIAKKELGIADDDWRDLVESLYGTRSVAALSINQLTAFVEHLRTKGFNDKRSKPRDSGISNPVDVPRETINGPNAGVIAKLRALWLSLYNLGIVEDPKDSALEAFVQRQTKSANAGAGIKKLRWLPQSDAYLAIEALKSWAAREGVDWDASKEDPRDCIILAMVRKCVKLGVFQYPQQIASRTFDMFGTSHFQTLDGGRKDALMQILGGEIRAQLKKGDQ